MLIFQLTLLLYTITLTIEVQYPLNSDVSTDDKTAPKTIVTNKTEDVSDTDESGREIDTDIDDVRDKKFLAYAMQTIMDPNNLYLVGTNNEEIEHFKSQLEKIQKDNITLDEFMERMDQLSLEVCKTSQAALWSYVTDINNDMKKNKMINIAAEEDEIKKQYWNMIKQKYLSSEDVSTDQAINRKIRIIKERGTNVQIPQSKQREEIDTMQRMWSRVSVCSYNSTDCNEENMKSMSDVIATFKTSNDTRELSYYWKAYRDATGKKARPIFNDYVSRMNKVAVSENFSDAGEMWRYAYEDDHFVETVDRIWHEIKPFYNNLHDYVRNKLKKYYKEDLKKDVNCIPAHLLGNLWAQEWQSIYPKVAPYPEYPRPKIADNHILHSKELFDAVDDFHQSLGFESASDSYASIQDTMSTANCLPSSHDMCDGTNYKIKWCGDPVRDAAVGLSRAARLLGHVQYFKHYRHLRPLLRDGPTPAFHDAVSDIVAVQLTTPDYLKKLSFLSVTTGMQSTINHLLWLALEKFPLMAYAYVLDKWRWDVFANKTQEWNRHWWELRAVETGVSAPVPRDETDLDPAAKYHVVSHVQYITYLISHILEFQILLSLCNKANHTGPLHECSLYGVKEAGQLLSDGMSLGASEDWRTVLKTMTGETELSTKGILEYFSQLDTFLTAQNIMLAQAVEEDVDQNAPIIVGIIVVVLTLLIVSVYCIKKYNLWRKMSSACGWSKNGSLDIAKINSHMKNNEDAICEDKV